MDALQKQDVPYGNDWDSATEAAAYGEAADQARPWRSEIRDHIAARIAKLAPRARVLELGSGPGLLAHRVLQRCPHLETYTLMDFSHAGVEPGTSRGISSSLLCARQLQIRGLDAPRRRSV